MSPFEASYDEVELLVPYAQQRLVSQMHEQGKVVSENYGDEGVTVKFRAEPQVIAQLRAQLARP